MEVGSRMEGGIATIDLLLAKLKQSRKQLGERLPRH